MKTPTWYSTPERIAALEAEAGRWVGTPFRLGSHVCGAGGGVDCANLLSELHFSTGCMERFALPSISPRSFVHDGGSSLLAVFDQVAAGRFLPVAEGEPVLPGDALFIRYGATLQHMVTMLGRGECVHAMVRTGVTRLQLQAVLGVLRGKPQVVAMRRPRP